MGQPVVHFEIVGRDAEALHDYYTQLFGWQMDDPIGPMSYRVVPREGNLNAEGAGIGGGVGGGMEGYDGHVTFYVEVPDIHAALADAQRLCGAHRMGPDQAPGGPLIAQFTDPEGHMVGLVQSV